MIETEHLDFENVNEHDVELHNDVIVENDTPNFKHDTNQVDLNSDALFEHVSCIRFAPNKFHDEFSY